MACEYSFDGGKTFISKEEFIKQLAEGKLDEFINEGVIKLGNIRGDGKVELDEEQEVKQVAEKTSITPKNLKDLYDINRKLFGLDRLKSLAAAITMDRMIGVMAKRANISKAEMYSKLNFQKASEQDIPQGVKFQVDAFHGSPYEFDKFSTQKIGTGEGAQAFGWGLYFTDLESIARNYATTLRKDVDTYRELSKDEAIELIKSKKDGFEFVDGKISNDLEGIKYIEERYKNNDPLFTEKGVAALYKVSLHEGKTPEQYTWLEWDKPVSDKVANLLEKAGIPAKINGKARIGSDVYEGLATREGRKEASIKLLQNGIDGVKYPAESISRGATSDNAIGFNYVVFDENAVSIKEVIKFQKDANKSRGAVMVSMDGQATIYALTDPNVSTPVHELAHVFEHYLTNEERQEVIKNAGTKEWDIKTSEYFARGFEKYLANGNAPTEGLKKVFQKFKQWLTEIYNGIKDSEIDIELSPKMEEIYAKMLGEDAVKKKQPPPPKTPPTQKEGEEGGSKKQRRLGILNRLMKSENVSEANKKLLEENGLNYEVSSQPEAQQLAKEMVDALGVDAALEAARSELIDPSVGSAVFAESLNTLFSQENDLRTEGKIEEANAIAETWADVSYEYAEISNKKGKWNSQIAYFYKTSPMGFVKRIEEQRAETFKDWFEQNEEPFQEVFDIIKETQEFVDIFKEEVEKSRIEERKAERAEKKEKVYKKIDDWADKWSKKLSPSTTEGKDIQKQGLGVPEVMKAAATLAKKLYDAGTAVSKIIEDVTAYVSEKIGNENWDKEDFKNSLTELVSGFSGAGKTEAQLLQERIKSLESQIAEYNKLIEQGGARKTKTPEQKFKDNEQIVKLIKERDELRKENQRLIRAKTPSTPSEEAINKRIQKLEEELQRVKDRKDKEPSQIKKRELTEEEKSIIDDIKAEKERWAKEVEPSKKQAAEIKRKQDRIKELNRRVDEMDFTAEAYKAKKEKTELDEELEKAKKAYDEAKKVSPEYIDKKAKQYLTQLRKRLSGLSEEKKEEIVRRSIKKIIDSGGLQYDDFKDIVSNVMGLGKLTIEQQKEIESLTEKANEVDQIELDYVQNPTKEGLDKYIKAKQGSLEANRKLFELTHNEADITGTVKSIMTLNLLNLSTVIANYFQNAIYQGIVRFPTSVIVNGIEYSKYGASLLSNRLIGTKVIKPQTNPIEAQKGYWKEYNQGLIRGWQQTIKGVDEKDYFSSNQYAANLNPLKSYRDLVASIRGDLQLSNKQKVDKFLQSTIGVQAYGISRLMTLGDKPPRYGAQGAEAMQIGENELNLTNPLELEAFVNAPERFSYNYFVKQGMSPKDAGIKSKELTNRIVDAGAKAVFQNENVLNFYLSKIDEASKLQDKDRNFMKGVKTFVSLGKAYTLPFVKTPANIWWAYFKLNNPALTFAKGVYELYEASVASKKGNFIEANRLRKQSNESIALAVIGYGFAVAAMTLYQKGLVRASNDDEDKAKEKAAETFFGSDNKLNLGKFLGGDDYWVDLTWFPGLGAVIDTQANLLEDKKKRGEDISKEDFNFLEDFLPNLKYSSIASLNSLIFDNGTRILDGLRKGGNYGERLLVDMVNRATGTVVGSTFQRASSLALPHKIDTQADNIMERISNSVKEKNAIVRFFSDAPKAKISIWGEPVTQDNSVWGILRAMFKIEKGSNDKFGLILYDDFQRTGNVNFLPPYEDAKITHQGKSIELNAEQKRDLDRFVGQARKNLIAPYISDAAIIGAYGNYYSKLKDEQKIASLKEIYENAKKVGYYKFQEKYTEFANSEIKYSLSEEKRIEKEKEKLSKQFEKESKTLLKD